MQHIVSSLLRPCRSDLQRVAATAAGRISNFEGFLLSERSTIASRSMQTTSQTLDSNNSSSATPKPDVNEPKPDTPDDVAPEIQQGGAPMDLNLNEREGGEGGPGKIPMKNEPVKEEIHHGEGEKKGKGGAGAESKSSGQQEGDGSMGPDSVGDTHRLDYSR